MKKKSFLHILSVLMRIQMAMLAVVLAVFLVMAYRTAEDKQRTALGNYTSIYKSQIENRLSRCTDVLSELVYGNTDLDMLRSSSEAERQYAAVNLSNDMVSLMRITEGPELLLVAEASQDLLVSVKDGGVTLAEEQELKELAMLTATTGNQLWEWQVAGIPLPGAGPGEPGRAGGGVGGGAAERFPRGGPVADLFLFKGRRRTGARADRRGSGQAGADHAQLGHAPGERRL